MIDADRLRDVQAAAEAAHRRAGGDPELLRALVAMVGEDEELPGKWRSGAWNLVTDSLAGLRIDRVAAARRLADIGSGAGFPGLVLATALPAAQVTLIERKRERNRFLHRAVEGLGLRNVEVVAVPAQAWEPRGGACDVVTARNVSPLNVMVELAAPMLRLGGAAVLWNRRRRGSVEAEGNAAAGVVGLRSEEVREDGPRRTIYVYAKVAETPSGFPRPGTAAFDDPLGADIDPGDWVPDDGAVRLTPLEQRVLELLADDRRDFEIATELDLPLRYAREQVRRVRRKLAAKTIEETVARARGCGLLPAEGASVAP